MKEMNKYGCLLSLVFLVWCMLMFLICNAQKHDRKRVHLRRNGDGNRTIFGRGREDQRKVRFEGALLQNASQCPKA